MIFFDFCFNKRYNLLFLQHTLYNFLPVKILPYVKEILMLRKTLLIPGLGTFTVRLVAAHKASFGYFLPPGAEIDFQEDRKTDDGFLKKYLTRRISLSETESEKEIRLFTDKIIQETALGKYTLEEFGTFRLSAGKMICFTQAMEFNVNPEGYGLQPIKTPDMLQAFPGKAVKPAVQKTKKPEKLKKSENPDTFQEGEEREGVKTSDIWIAIACGLVTFIAGVWLVNYFTHGGVLALLNL